MRGWRLRRGKTTASDSGLLMLGVAALIAGALSGLIVAMFRLALVRADVWRTALIVAAHHYPFVGFALIVAGAAAAFALAAWLVRRFSPFATGSGIPQIEAALHGHLPAETPPLLPVKFGGGLLAIGAGGALGREGPSVQMGAVVSRLIGLVFRRTWPDLQRLIAAGAGAGLAVAFNAPLAGAIFVLEELFQRFEARMAMAALAASGMAMLIARLFLGNAPDFQVTIATHAAAATGPLPYATHATMPLYLVLGVAAGVTAACYNRAIIGLILLADRLDRLITWCPVEVQAAAIGAGIGITGWFLPGLIGGGDNITQRVLAGDMAIGAIPLAFLIRFWLGPISYAARTPGGLFAPLLVLGAQLGLVVGTLCQLVFPSLGIAPKAFAVVGMAAFFAGVVQAPVTGIVLVTEMTAAFTTLLPMVAACFAAMLTAHLLRVPPIYDWLRERVVSQHRAMVEAEAPATTSAHD
jgi:CIC family chloride channel protein